MATFDEKGVPEELLIHLLQKAASWYVKPLLAGFHNACCFRISLAILQIYQFTLSLDKIDQIKEFGGRARLEGNEEFLAEHFLQFLYLVWDYLILKLINFLQLFFILVNGYYEHDSLYVVCRITQ